MPDAARGAAIFCIMAFIFCIVLQGVDDVVKQVVD